MNFSAPLRLRRRLFLGLMALGLPRVASATPKYAIDEVLVAKDEWQGEGGKIEPRPIFKPHETDTSVLPDFWVASNERDDEGGITVLTPGSNKVLAQFNIDDACIKVVQPNGKLGGCAPPGAEGNPRHPHGIDIDVVRKRAYQVIEHSGLKWNATRTGFEVAQTADEESGLLAVYDLEDPKKPRLRGGYVLGHAAEEAAVNEVNGKVYVGNHEPSTLGDPNADGATACFVSVIRPGSHSPYGFIDLEIEDCVQGIEVNETLQLVYGATHIGEKMIAFTSSDDEIAYSVDIRSPFLDQVPGAAELLVGDNVLHLHDLTTSPLLLRAYQTIHTVGTAIEDEEQEGEDGEVEAEGDISGRWVAEVNIDPSSNAYKKVRILDLSNGQPADEVPSSSDATGPFNKRFVHAHFVAVDPLRNTLLVSGEHTGNLGIVDLAKGKLRQVLAISRTIPGCELTPDPETGEVPEAEPHVHGVNIDPKTGRAYVSDEGEDCFYESVTVVEPDSDADDDDDDDDDGSSPAGCDYDDLGGEGSFALLLGMVPLALWPRRRSKLNIA